MPVSLHGRSLLTLADFSADEIRYLLDLAAQLKAKKKQGLYQPALLGKNLVLLFEKTSTRTRCAFEVAAHDEGAHVTYLDMAGSQMNKKESLEDTAKVLGRFYDGIEYRGFAQKTVEDLAAFSGVPVFNGLTDQDHPTQVLADLLTIGEHVHKPLNQVRLAYVGDTRNNVALALMTGCAKMGMTFVGLGPKSLAPDAGFWTQVQAEAARSGASVSLADDPAKVRNVDVVYTDVWVSMGEEDLLAERAALLTPYRVTQALFGYMIRENGIFMHDLPSCHDFETAMAQKALAQGYDIREVEDEVYRGARSVVFDQAENRLHTIKAVLVAMMG